MLRLDAVNRMLVSAQMNAVAALSSPDLMAYKATAILDEVHARELEHGWDFNKNADYSLTLASGNFAIPTTPWTVLRLDVRPENSGSKEIVVRDGLLYDKTNHTFTFTEATIKVDITWLVTFDNCPLVMQEHIVADACVRFAVEVSVDPTIANQLRVNAMQAKQRIKQYDSQTSSASIYARWPLAMIARRWPQMLR